MKKNLFIAFEGIDGSGKSTQVKLLKERLEQAGQNVYATYEPTDSAIGRMIRDIFSHRMDADHATIAGLFVADRLDHLLNKENGVLKMLGEGYTVITDRYYLSSYAYHSVHVSMDWVIAANALSAELLRPDLNIFIDITPQTAMQRLDKGRNNLELYETLDNLNKVREKYTEAMERLKNIEKIVRIDGNRSPEVIAGDIWMEVAGMMG